LFLRRLQVLHFDALHVTLFYQLIVYLLSILCCYFPKRTDAMHHCSRVFMDAAVTPLLQQRCGHALARGLFPHRLSPGLEVYEHMGDSDAAGC
jgi:hypothetical protein